MDHQAVRLLMNIKDALEADMEVTIFVPEPVGARRVTKAGFEDEADGIFSFRDLDGNQLVIRDTALIGARIAEPEFD